MPLFKRTPRISFNPALSGQPIFLWSTIGSAVLLVLMVALPIWKLAPLAESRNVFSLHYNVFFGVDLVGPWFSVLYVPVLGCILLVANRTFTRVLFEREQLLSYFFAITTLMIEALLFVAVVLITLLNV